MPQLQHRHILHDIQGSNGCIIKLAAAIGTLYAALDFLVGIISQEAAQHPGSPLLIRELCQPLDELHIHLGQLIRHEQAAIIGKACNNRLGRRHFLVISSCADVIHIISSLLNRFSKLTNIIFINILHKQFI